MTNNSQQSGALSTEHSAALYAVQRENKRLRETLQEIYSHAQEEYDGPEDHTHGPYLELAGVALGKMP